MLKSELRIIMRHKREQLSKSDIKLLSDQLLHSFINSELKDHIFYMVYMPINNEADTQGLIEYLFINNKQVTIPYINGQNEMIAVEINRQTEYVTDSFGIRIPKSLVVVEKEKLEVIIVPGIAFDKKGYRVGYGKGYYDKFLFDIDPMTVAWCYDFQKIDRIDDIKNTDIPIKRFLLFE